MPQWGVLGGAPLPKLILSIFMCLDSISLTIIINLLFSFRNKKKKKKNVENIKSFRKYWPWRYSSLKVRIRIFSGDTPNDIYSSGQSVDDGALLY